MPGPATMGVAVLGHVIAVVTVAGAMALMLPASAEPTDGTAASTSGASGSPVNALMINVCPAGAWKSTTFRKAARRVWRRAA